MKEVRKVDQDTVITIEDKQDQTTQQWRLKRGKRANRVVKWESKWYRQYGLSERCSICGGPHSSMRKVIRENGSHIYHYNCKVARWNQWPVEGIPIHKFTIWDSLEICPAKFAECYHYNRDDIEAALDQWTTGICGLLMSDENRETFKRQVRMIFEEVRQSWTFKRTQYPPIGRSEDEDDEEDTLSC